MSAAADTDEVVYIADSGNDRVLRISPDGAQSTYAESIQASGLAVDSVGRVFISDAGAGSVYQVDVPPFADDAVATGLSKPVGLAAQTQVEEVVIAESGANRLSFYPYAGGPATSSISDVVSPEGVAVVPSGTLRDFVVFVSEPTNDRVLRINVSEGTRTTVGTGLNRPQGLARDVAGNLVIADTGNDRVVRVPADGGPQTTVGTGLRGPAGVAVDLSGAVVIADTENDRVVRVPADGGPQTTIGTGLRRPGAVAVGLANRGVVPGYPTGVSATAGDAQATVSWDAPVGGGAAPVIGYTVTAAPAGRTCTTVVALSCTVTGLDNGTAYTFTVTANNRFGPSGPSAASVRVTPGSADLQVTVTPGLSIRAPGPVTATIAVTNVGPVDSGAATTRVLTTLRVTDPGGATSERALLGVTQLVFTSDGIGAGETVTRTITADAAGGLPVLAAFARAATADPNPVNNVGLTAFLIR